GVVHLTHLVQVDERVELGQVNPGERAADREALALEAGRSRGYREHGALGSGGGSWFLDAGEDQDAGNSDRGHDLSFVLRARLHPSFAVQRMVDSSTFPSGCALDASVPLAAEIAEGRRGPRASRKLPSSIRT